MKNIIIIVHDGVELTSDEEEKLALIVANSTSCDKTKIRLSQLSSDEALKMVAGVILKRSGIDQKYTSSLHEEQNSEEIRKSIEMLKGTLSLGGVFPNPSEFGKQLTIRLIGNVNSRNKMETALRNAVAILSQNIDDINFDATECRQSNFTKVHAVELQRIHKFYASYMLQYVSYS